MKLKTGSEELRFIQQHILEKKFSPGVVAALMKAADMADAVCEKTLYTYIENGWIPGVSNDSLWEKRRRGVKHKSLTRQAKRVAKPGHSITGRPPEVEPREEFGHWEIDLVVSGTGKGEAVLLTLVERLSRNIVIRRLKGKTQAEVLKALKQLEQTLGKEAFRLIFKSITADNGSEFLNTDELEESIFGGKRTHVYYAHAYSSRERRSNENANRLIRRFIPKGSDISKYTHRRIKEIETWMNGYPRKQLGYKTAEEIYIQHAA